MIPIKVSIGGAIDAYDLSEAQAAELASLVTMSLANTYANSMIALAKIRLNSTRKMFVDGIRVTEISKYQSCVEIIGVMPNAVTFGMSPYDMKIGFAKSSKKTAKKGGGWYLTIPFRYANPDAVASSTVFSSVMPPAVYNLARMLTSGGKGLAASALPEGFNEALFRPASESAAGITPAYQHDSPMFAGMTKSGKGNQTQYNTFRRVSDKSNSNSWMSKGIEAKNIHSDALNSMDMETQSKMVIDAYLDRFH